jgi:hypothetical protein
MRNWVKVSGTPPRDAATIKKPGRYVLAKLLAKEAKLRQRKVAQTQEGGEALPPRKQPRSGRQTRAAFGGVALIVTAPDARANDAGMPTIYATAPRHK